MSTLASARACFSGTCAKGGWHAFAQPHRHDRAGGELCGVRRAGAGAFEAARLVGPVEEHQRHPVGSDQAARPRPRGHADGRISGALRGQSQGSGGGRARRRSDRPVHPARHAAGHDRGLSDGDRHHTEDHLRADRLHHTAAHLHRRPRLAAGARPELQRHLDRPLGRPRCRGPLHRAGGRDARAKSPMLPIRNLRPHPEGRAQRGVSKDGHRRCRCPGPSVETAAPRGAASSGWGPPSPSPWETACSD